MTHPESQELLLDFAYGELPPLRAAELEVHLAGCEECLREKAALDEARRLAAPLRREEEPPVGFDDRILAAARAQAQLTHEGNIGQVIDVQGSVRPMGLEPARIDAHAKVAPRESKRPRWMVRAALGGSVAAAAALALVMSTSLRQKREVERDAHPASDQAFEIRVRPAPVPEATREAVRAAVKEEAAPPPVAAGSRPEVIADEAAAAKQISGEPRLKKKVAAPKNLAGPGASLGVTGGSGGDGTAAREPSPPPALAARPPPAPARAPPPAPAAGQSPAPAAAPSPAPMAESRSSLPSARPEPAVEEKRARTEDAQTREPVPARSSIAMAQKAAPQAVSAAPAAAEPAEKSAEKPLARSETAAQLEQQAQEARRGGDYPLAATLYRRAADLRRAAASPGNEGAWDLAHAVECLAAAGRFDEGRTVRDELARLYPAESGAFAAARRALR